MPDEHKNVVALKAEADALPDQAALLEIRDTLDGFEDRKATHKGEYMKKCAVINDEKADYFEKLASKGINTKATKAWYKIELLKRKEEKVREDIKEADQDFFDHIEEQMDLFPQRDLKRAS